MTPLLNIDLMIGDFWFTYFLLPRNLFSVLKEMGKFLILSDAMQTKTEVIHLNTIGQVKISTHLVQEFGFGCRSVPSVVQNENVWL
jgi:hypothetical protein